MNLKTSYPLWIMRIIYWLLCLLLINTSMATAHGHFG